MPQRALGPVPGDGRLADPAALPRPRVAWPVGLTPPQMDADGVALGANGLAPHIWPGAVALTGLDGQPPCEWSVVDTDGTPILEAARYRFLAALSKGWELLLLERADANSQWRLRRRAHIACAPRRQDAYRALAEASVLLVRQGAKDRELGLPTDAVPEGFAVDPVNGQPRVPRQADFSEKLAAFNVWWERQMARFRTEHWCIGVIDAPIHKVLQKERLQVRWITQPEQHGYWADPFGVPGNSERMAVEYFDQRTGLGRLETLTLDAEGELRFREKVTLQHDGHASFPAVFELDGRRLGLAEVLESNRITLHEVDIHGRWTEVADLLLDVKAADPVLFKHENLYWLAYTDMAIGSVDNLCLMYAQSLAGPWQAHANNPVKVDISSARMAGRPFVHEGRLYRPAQDCLKRYGSAVVIHRVDSLSPTHFEETPVRRLVADPHSHLPHGMHTVSAWGDRTLVDAKIERMNPVNLLRKVRERLGRPASADAQRHSNDDRVFVYIPHLRTGGGEISMLRVAEGLAERGLEVEVVVNDMGTRELPLPRGVSLIDLQASGSAQAVRRLAQRIKKREPRFVISGFPHTNVATITAVKLARTGAISVVTEHAPLTHQIEQQNNWRYRALPWLVKTAYRRADAIVAVSSGVREDLKRIVGRKVRIHCIHNPVLPDNFESVAEQEPDHPWLNDPGVQVVMSMCRLSEEKDLPTLIRAFARLRVSHPVARLMLVGEGPERAHLQALIDEAGLTDVAVMPGRTPEPLCWMRKAAVFVLSSTFEGYGNVLVEALAVGTPVVSTDCPVGPREILDNGRYGDLVPVHDDTAMSRAISRALTVRRLPDGAHLAARKRTQSRACDDYLALLNHLDLTRN